MLNNISIFCNNLRSYFLEVPQEPLQDSEEESTASSIGKIALSSIATQVLQENTGIPAGDFSRFKGSSNSEYAEFKENSLHLISSLSRFDQVIAKHTNDSVAGIIDKDPTSPSYMISQGIEHQYHDYIEQRLTKEFLCGASIDQLLDALDKRLIPRPGSNVLAFIIDERILLLEYAMQKICRSDAQTDRSKLQKLIHHLIFRALNDFHLFNLNPINNYEWLSNSDSTKKIIKSIELIYQRNSNIQKLDEISKLIITLKTNFFSSDL